MTELSSFLTSLYASVTEAELQSRRHGEARLAELLAAGELTEEDALPVYHARDVAVTLDVCLSAEATEHGHEMHVTDECDDDTSLSFTIDLLDVVDREDLSDDGTPNDDGTPGDSDGTPDDPDEGRDGDGPGEKPDDGDDDPDGDDANGEGRFPVELVDGIGPKRAHRLREAGVRWVQQLVELPAEKIAEIVSQDGETVSVEEAQQWLVRATHVLARDRHARGLRDGTAKRRRSSARRNAGKRDRDRGRNDEDAEHKR